MSKILLDYFFPISSIEPTQQASTAFLKQALLIVKPKSGVTPGTISNCSTMAQVLALTDNSEAEQLFAGGLSKVYILPLATLDAATALVGHESDFFTILVSSDFTPTDITVTEATGVVTVSGFANLLSGAADTVTVNGTVFTAQSGAAVLGTTTFQAATSNSATAASLAAQINAHATIKLVVAATVVGAVLTLRAVNSGLAGNDITLVYTNNDAAVGIVLSGLTSGKLTGGNGMFLGQFKGIVGVSSTDDAFLATQAAITNRAAFHTKTGTNAKNMLFAFGKMLGNALGWRNQQYITMPFVDDIDTLGEANTLFDAKINFTMSDDEFGNRLGLFAAGAKAIVSPYIIKNLQVDLQSAALSYVSGNQPAYTKKQGALLEDELQKVIQLYVDREWIEVGTVEIKLENDNWVASGYINVAEPKALWRIFGEMRQSL